jgi:hypothetical protein
VIADDIFGVVAAHPSVVDTTPPSLSNMVCVGRTWHRRGDQSVLAQIQ